MKISFVEPGVYWGCGGLRRIIETSNRLKKLGHEVNIFTPKGRPCKWMKNNVPVLKWDKLNRYEHDALIFNLADNYKVMLETNAKSKIFWVLAAEAEYKHPKVALEALNQDFYFIANSTFTANYIYKYKKLDYDIPITPAGINPKHFKYDPEIHKHYHVLYYGSSRPWKGTQLIESTLNTLNIKSLKMEGLNTSQDKMYTLYNQCNMFISAAQCEGFNMPILEAFACGCPVICTDDGGNKDFVKHGINALVVDRNVSSIRTAVNVLLKEKVLRNGLRREGLKTSRDPKYDWDNIAKNFETIIKSWV